MNWIAFSDMQISNLEEDLLDMQISDMTYIALDHIQRDQDFLEELLKTSDVKLSAPLQKTIESISDSLEEIMFAHAKTSDIPWINSCMEENLFDNLTDHKQWRLYYPVDEDEFKTYVGNQKNIFLCAKEENRVLGYILSYDVKQRMNKKETRFDDLQIPQWYKEKIQTEPVLYARHVAIDPKSQNQGIGKKLEKQTLQEAQQRWYKHVMWEIMTSPMRNITSLEVHQKAGFQTIGKISYPDWTCWDVVWKDL